MSFRAQVLFHCGRRSPFFNSRERPSTVEPLVLYIHVPFVIKITAKSTVSIWDGKNLDENFQKH